MIIIDTDILIKGEPIVNTSCTNLKERKTVK